MTESKNVQNKEINTGSSRYSQRFSPKNIPQIPKPQTTREHSIGLYISFLTIEKGPNPWITGGIVRVDNKFCTQFTSHKPRIVKTAINKSADNKGHLYLVIQYASIKYLRYEWEVIKKHLKLFETLWVNVLVKHLARFFVLPIQFLIKKHLHNFEAVASALDFLNLRKPQQYLLLKSGFSKMNQHFYIKWPWNLEIIYF